MFLFPEGFERITRQINEEKSVVFYRGCKFPLLFGKILLFDLIRLYFPASDTGRVS